MRFVLPHSPEQRPAWLIRLGLFLYDHLGGRELLPPSRALDLRRAPEGAPLRDEFGRGFVYSDCRVDDARLVILNVLDASTLGAPRASRTALIGARRDGGVWSLALRSGERRKQRARPRTGQRFRSLGRDGLGGPPARIRPSASGWSRAATSSPESSGRASKPISCKMSTSGWCSSVPTKGTSP